MPDAITPDLLLRMGGAGLTACLAALVLTPLVRRVALRYDLVSKPVDDRWGQRVIARLGGVAIFLAFGIAALAWSPPEASALGFSLGLALAFAWGLVDDVWRMPPYTKLVGQLVIGSLVVFSGVRFVLVPLWLSIPLSVLWLVLVMNAFNLLDNMDGLAAGIGAIASGFCVLHSMVAGQWVVAMVGMSIAGACVGFLRYNVPPAKIFMGDSGSHFLGLGLAGLAIMGNWRHSTQLLSVVAVPALVLAVPIFDTCFVTIQRLLHRQHPFAGGSDHVSHRLAILGLSVPQTVLVLYAISACLGALSILSVTLPPLFAIAIALFTLAAFLLLGRYLAQVRVRRFTSLGEDARLPAITKPVTFVDSMLLHKRRLVEILVDFALIASAYVGAHLMRYEGALDATQHALLVQSLPVILVIKLACFAGCGVYRSVWRYIGVSDILALFKATVLGSLLSSVVLLYLWRFEGYSRAVFVIDWMLLFLAVGGSRVAERLMDDWIKARTAHGVVSLIIGAGDTGARVLRSLHEEAPNRRRVIGFVDDDVRKHGSRLLGYRVLGGREDLPALIADHGVEEVLIAINDPPGHLLQDVRQCCESRGLAWKVVTAGVTAVS